MNMVESAEGDCEMKQTLPFRHDDDLRLEPEQGRVALWVGPGTEGYFSNLKIAAK